MTEQEFLKSISDKSVVVDLEKYERLIEHSTKMNVVKQIVERSNNNYGLSSDDTRVIKILLGITGGNNG